MLFSIFCTQRKKCPNPYIIKGFKRFSFWLKTNLRFAIDVPGGVYHSPGTLVLLGFQLGCVEMCRT